MEIAYAAYTDSCVFMLDDDGICRWVVTRGARASRQVVDNAQRCIGAQYVASLDLSSAGGLVSMPRVGAPMLFALVEPGGRIALVRTGPVQRFEDRKRAAGDVPADSAPTMPLDDAPSDSGEYETDAPDDGIDVDLDLGGDEGDDERTLRFGHRRFGDAASRETLPSPAGTLARSSRTTLTPPAPATLPDGGAGSGFARADEHGKTGRYLPVQQRALRKLARIKK